MIFITKTIKIELTDKEKLIFACSDSDAEEKHNDCYQADSISTQLINMGHSLLWLSCYRNQSEVVKHLLCQLSINLNQKDKDDQIPLYTLL